jgi:hypothetical protein
MASCSSARKKKVRGVWLVGGTIKEITGTKLPSKRQVLQRFFHFHNVDKESIQSSSSKTTQEILQLWNGARIPTKQEYNIINKIKELHSR